jgi:hypothetical protein
MDEGGAIVGSWVSKMSPRQVDLLLEELCVKLGFCLPREAQLRLRENPPLEIDAFVDAVIRAEGLDPQAGISLHLYRDMRERVVKHFKAAETNRDAV